MSNLFNNIKTNKKLTKHDFLKENKKTNKHFPSPIREWYNNIYAYNKNSLNLIPFITSNTNKIIKNYFNLYNWRLEKKMRAKRLLRRLRKLISNRYYISNPTFKHTNNKIIVNMFVYNRQKYNYYLAIKKLYLKFFYNIKSNDRKKIIHSNGIIKKEFYIIKKLILKIIKRLNVINKKGFKTFKYINNISIFKALKIIDKKYKYNEFNQLNIYTKNFYKKLINKSLKKLRMFFYYRQLLFINNAKVNYTYLQFLKKYMEKLYNKNIEFNIINLKRFYLNSDILSESVKLKLSRNRRKMLKHLKKVKNKIIIWKKKIFLGYNKVPLLTKPNLTQNRLLLQTYIFNNLKYKHVTGFRLEAKGRLTKRFTASRSISKTIYKGNLLEIDSSHRGESSVLLKGNLRSNAQYTVLKSKSRIGSFGVKGWVSGN